MGAKFRDFHYPTKWQLDRSKAFEPMYHLPPYRTLILSHVFKVTHCDGCKFDAVLSLQRADRQFMWMILARIPTAMNSEFIDSLKVNQWHGCADGHVEIALSMVDAGLDYPYHTRMYRKGATWDWTWNQPSLMHNVWLACDIGLRANGFKLPKDVFPFFKRVKA